MKLIVFGASGMVGAGVLREALADPEVESVLSIGRRSCGVEHPKLRELLMPDLFDLAAVEDRLVGYDACIWAVGVSSVGMSEAAYARVTEALTLVWARAAAAEPGALLLLLLGRRGRRAFDVGARSPARRGVAAVDAVSPRRRSPPGLHPARPRHSQPHAPLSGGARPPEAGLPALLVARAGLPVPVHDLRGPRPGDASRGRRTGRSVHPRDGRHQQGRGVSPVNRSSRVAKLGVVALVLVALVGAWHFGVFARVAEPKVLAATLVEMGAWGYLAFVLAYTLLQPFGVPGTIFIVAAPLIWPWRTAFALSMLGTMGASVVGFSFARFVARDWVAARPGPAPQVRRIARAERVPDGRVPAADPVDAAGAPLLPRRVEGGVLDPLLGLARRLRAAAAPGELPRRRDVRRVGADPARRVADPRRPAFGFAARHGVRPSPRAPSFPGGPRDAQRDVRELP
nr:hypothetical protein [Nannocystis pusilla]